MTSCVGVKSMKRECLGLMLAVAIFASTPAQAELPVYQDKAHAALWLVQDHRSFARDILGLDDYKTGDAIRYFVSHATDLTHVFGWKTQAFADNTYLVYFLFGRGRNVEYWVWAVHLKELPSIVFLNDRPELLVKYREWINRFVQPLQENYQEFYRVEQGSEELF